MGLDITAYSKIAPVDCAVGREDCMEHVSIWVNPDFPERACGLVDGCYTSSGERHSFGVGAYSGYNQWRRQLSLMAQGHEPRWEDYAAPFQELINFSDCEGAIGAEVAARLLKDFREYEAKAAEFWRGDDWGWRRYHEWKRACELASDSGVIVFH